MAVAAAGEVAGTASLRLSEGLTRPLFVVGVVVLYCASIAVFGRVLGRGLELGVAYGVLTSSGLAGATVLSVLVFGDPLTVVQGVGIMILGAGAWLLRAEHV